MPPPVASKAPFQWGIASYTGNGLEYTSHSSRPANAMAAFSNRINNREENFTP